VRNKMVLFGGFTLFNAVGQTHVLGTNGWTLAANSGPSARGAAAMAFDSARGVMVLFGGDTGQVNGETWEWNGTAWTQRAVSGPTPRGYHAMAFDASRGVTVLYGGYIAGGYTGDTWEYNGTTWVQKAASGPPALGATTMVYDSVRQKVLLMGGDDGAWNNQTWEWNGTTWTLRAGEALLGQRVEREGDQRTERARGTRDGVRRRALGDCRLRRLAEYLVCERHLGLERHAVDPKGGRWPVSPGVRRDDL
jgi:hypothetical protein